MSLPARDDIDPEHRFDLTRIYATPDDWADARADLLDHLDDLRARAEEPLEAADDLRTLLGAVEECYRRKQRLELYATLYRNVNTEEDAADDRMRRYRELESAFEPAVAAARRRLRAADGAVEAFLPELPEYRHYAENLLEEATHTRSGEVEEALAAFEDLRSAPEEVIVAATTEDFDPPTVERPDGETVAIRDGNVRSELSHPDRGYRRRVYEAYHAEMDRFEHALTRAYAGDLQAAAAEVAVRGYGSIRDRDFRGRCYPESGLKSRLPGKVHDAMLDGVRGNLGPYHRALEVRRERLGVETLRPWDLDVSIADADPPELDYGEAKAHVLDALAPLGAGYVERLEAFFEERRIDVFPTEGKRTDIPAYCPSSATDGAYILANFRGDARTTFYLCHELGHAMHVEHHREGPARYATCPRPIEEVASIVNELLLAEHFIEEGGALAEAARNRLVECIGGNLYRSAMSSAFAHAMATTIEDGEEVTPERARGAWGDLLSEFHPAVEYDDRAGRNWLGRGWRAPYSSYQYVLGAVGAIAVREGLRDGTLTTEAYREFLRGTGRHTAVASFERLGLDVGTPEPYASATEAFEGYVEEIRS